MKLSVYLQTKKHIDSMYLVMGKPTYHQTLYIQIVKESLKQPKKNRKNKIKYATHCTSITN